MLPTSTHVRAIPNGRPVEDDWRFTKIYQRTAGGWRVVSFHTSEAPTPLTVHLYLPQ